MDCVAWNQTCQVVCTKAFAKKRSMLHFFSLNMAFMGILINVYSCDATPYIAVKVENVIPMSCQYSILHVIQSRPFDICRLHIKREESLIA